jgi:hypothetical protein
MAIILAYETACTYYRLARAGLAKLPLATTHDPLDEAGSGVRRLAAGGLTNLSLSMSDLTQRGIVPVSERLMGQRSMAQKDFDRLLDRILEGDQLGYSLPRPYDVAIANQQRRGAAKRDIVHTHVCGTRLPKGSFRQIADEVYIVSPELLFVQLAQLHQHLHTVAAFGCELTGDYALLPRGLASLRGLYDEREAFDLRRLQPADVLRADGYVACRALSTCERLGSYLDSLPAHMYGAHRARVALAWVKDASRSPMETASSLHLRLPRMQGGFGAGDAEFNVRLPIGEDWQKALGKPYVVVDEHFVGRNGHEVDVEYNGRGGHSLPQQVMADNQRRHALEAAGHRVVFVTARDFFDYATWEQVAESLVAYLGKHQTAPSVAMLERRQGVHADLTNRLFLK